MGASYVYKNFSPQDKAIIPFNAHKQYNFSSASAYTNKIKTLTAQYTSESVSLYSSESSAYGGDTKNVIKYNQLDHLFYKGYPKNPNKRDFINQFEQPRELHNITNILSIPTGLYGSQIRKNSFYLSSSIYEVVDDSYGNLIISGTNVNDYPTNVNHNVFRLDPIKGYKKYDLAVYDGYANVVGGDFIGPTGIINPSPSQIQNFGNPINQIIHKSHYRQGLHNPRAPQTWTSNNQRYPLKYYPIDEDDSYYFNEIHYDNAYLYLLPIFLVL